MNSTPTSSPGAPGEVYQLSDLLFAVLTVNQTVSLCEDMRQSYADKAARPEEQRQLGRPLWLGNCGGRTAAAAVGN
jgi:hypothetical protein